MSNIIDFNSYKRSRDPELLHPQGEAETLHALDNAFLDYIQAFPSSSLMDDIHNRVANQLQRLESLETISARVSETIAKTGFDPNNFRIDEAHFHAFLMRDIQTVSDELSEWIVDPDIYWNGPYYDWQQGDTLIRAATTILRHEDGDVELLIDLVKMEPGSQHWLMWKDGKWEIDEFLEEIEEELRRR